jgi:hypothetical protein
MRRLTAPASGDILEDILRDLSVTVELTVRNAVNYIVLLYEDLLLLDYPVPYLQLLPKRTNQHLFLCLLLLQPPLTHLYLAQLHLHLLLTIVRHQVGHPLLPSKTRLNLIHHFTTSQYQVLQTVLQH